MPILCLERYLPLFSFFYLNKVIGSFQVKGSEPLGALESIAKFEDEGKQVAVFNSDFIKLLVVYAKA